MRRYLLLLAVTACTTQVSAQSALSKWVEVTGAGVEVRAIVPAGQACPVATVDGRALKLERRPAPVHASAEFPETCQALLPAHARTIQLEGQRLPAPTSDVKRMVVIGDTGCRVTEAEAQDCAKDWPFARIAAFAAAQKPDLIIHVGDYYYREKCSGGEKHCENWQNWRTDFFAPAAPMFGSAPWIFARGNHETCNRAGEGWFRFLDAADVPVPCPKAMAAGFDINLKGLTLTVLDTADQVDALPADKKLAAFKQEIDGLHPRAGVPEWIVTHKPPFVQGFMNGDEKGNAVETDPALPDVQLVLGGHLHLFGSLTFGEQRPAELIVGDSGTRLMVEASKIDKELSTQSSEAMLTGRKPVDGKAADFTMKGRFGYFLFEHSRGGWNGKLYDVDNVVLATCTLRQRDLRCVPATH